MMEYKNKLTGSEDERAVSPVIGVILMVAITVILAAVIAAFVLDLGGSIGEEAQAGVSIDTSGDEVIVEVTSAGNVEAIDVSTDPDDGDDDLNVGVDGSEELDGAAGERVTFTFGDDGYVTDGERDLDVDVTAVGTTGDGTESVVQSSTVTVTVEEDS